MLILQSEITIGTLTTKYLCECVVSSSWENFTDTAEISLPTDFRNNNSNLLERIRKGDAVTVKVGYVPNKIQIFTGYVSAVGSPSNPVKIKCEDLMWKLKQVTVAAFSERSLTLDALFKAIMPSYVSYKVADAFLGTLRVSNVNVVEVLEALKKTYGLYSYVREGVLYCGLPYTGQGTHHIIYMNGEKGTVIDNSLEYQKTVDTKIALKGTLFNEDNTKLERWCHYVPDVLNTVNGVPTDVPTISTKSVDGELRTLSYFGISQKEFEQSLKDRLPNFNYTGFRGDFTTFAYPQIKHGDIIDLINPKFPETNGSYLVKKVETSFGTEGGRQKVTLDAKVG